MGQKFSSCCRRRRSEEEQHLLAEPTDTPPVAEEDTFWSYCRRRRSEEEQHLLAEPNDTPPQAEEDTFLSFVARQHRRQPRPRRRPRRRGAKEQILLEELAEIPPRAGEDEESLSAGVGRTGGVRSLSIPSVPTYDDRSPTPSKYSTREEERRDSPTSPSGALGAASQLSSASGTCARVRVCVMQIQ